MSLASDPYPAAHSPRSGRAPRNPSTPWSRFVCSDPDAAPNALSLPPSSAATIPPPEPSSRSPEHAAAPPDAARPPPSGSPDHGADGNAATAARGKKPAWDRLSNSSIEAGPIMGAVSWPALSESTRAAPKSSSSDSLKTLSAGSLSAPPGSVIASPPPKTSLDNPNPSPIPNHVAPAIEKPMKHGDGAGASSRSGAPAYGGPSPTPPLLPSVDKQDNPEPSPKVLPGKGSNNWDRGSRGSSGHALQFHGGGDHHRGYGGNRGSGGGGSHHGRFGNRRDQERGSYDRNPPRNFGGRDAHVPPPQHRGHPPPFFRPPPAVPAPFISPVSPIRPFVNPMGFPDIPSQVYYVHPPPESLRGIPFVAHPGPHAIPPSMFIAAPDHQRAMLVNQIDYYFSSENLCRDVYLRQNMDDDGWVHISVIARFNKVKQLTNNIQYVLDAVRSSTIMEIQGEKIRRRNDWRNWVLPPSLRQNGTASGPQSATTNSEAVMAHMQSIGLEEGATDNATRVSTPTD